jgi:hypothetical protein
MGLLDRPVQGIRDEIDSDFGTCGRTISLIKEARSCSP